MLTIINIQYAIDLFSSPLRLPDDVDVMDVVDVVDVVDSIDAINVIPDDSIQAAYQVILNLQVDSCPLEAPSLLCAVIEVKYLIL